jgi:hypothetical protein
MAIYDINGNVISSGGSGGSPIVNERILMIGDSNMQYNAAGFKSYIEETYDCSFTVLAKAGVGWEYTGGDKESASEVTAECGVGYVNQLISQANGNIFTAWDKIVVMLGTNCWNMGAITDSASDFDTMCGAMRYCMEKLIYYGRAIKIGVVIPLRIDDGGNDYTPSATLEQMPQKFQLIKEISRQYAVPTLNVWDDGRIISNKFTPDGPSYYLMDTNHMGVNGSTQLMTMLGKWLAYCL